MADATTSANDTNVGHGQTVAEHYNKLPEKGKEERKQSRIFYMRNYNNWIKSMLINDVITRIRSSTSDSDHTISVLDLGSGKGGDLLKWKSAHINHLICADIADESVSQAENRYKDMRGGAKFTGEFIAADCTKERLKDKYKKADTKIDITSCQFAFHYSFESEAQAEMMLQNACESLNVGGYFIGTMPNAYELVKRVRSSEGMAFGNEVYKVTFQTTDKQHLPLFGAQYDFHLEGVVDCPEFLVYFPLLEKMAEKYDMELVYKKSFSDFYQEKIDTKDGRQLMSRMQGLEAYPAAEGAELLSKESDGYLAAAQQLDMWKSREPEYPHKHTLGTLSKAEWDATSLYLVFAFKKVKPADVGTQKT